MYPNYINVELNNVDRAVIAYEMYVFKYVKEYVSNKKIQNFFFIFFRKRELSEFSISFKCKV